jgi:hypothetical protein
MAYDSDVVICLDDCTHVDASFDEQKLSVKRTVAWAKRAKAEYVHLIGQKKLNENTRPRIFGVIQGGGYPDLRRECADALLEIGFDGFGYGGWPLDGQGGLLEDMLGLVRELVPARFPLHALGVGHPANVLRCHQLGYGIFDSAMPTRDARHGRLYTAVKPAGQGDWLKYLYINDEKHIKSAEPLEPGCDCPTCRDTLARVSASSVQNERHAVFPAGNHAQPAFYDPFNRAVGCTDCGRRRKRLSDPLELERLVAAVREGAGYRCIDESLIRQVAQAELAKGRKPKETVKAVRNKLHQVGGAYQEGGIDYPRLEAQLAELAAHAAANAAADLADPALREFL